MFDKSLNTPLPLIINNRDTSIISMTAFLVSSLHFEQRAVHRVMIKTISRYFQILTWFYINTWQAECFLITSQKEKLLFTVMSNHLSLKSHSGTSPFLMINTLSNKIKKCSMLEKLQCHCKLRCHIKYQW